jgi:hypothetical protein
MKADRHIFDFPNVKIHFGSTFKKSKDSVYVYDRFAPENNQQWSKEVKIDCNVWGVKSNDKNWLIAPFPMSPKQYLYGRQNMVHDFRSREKKFKIIFSGNTDKKSYTNPIIDDFFNKINRYEIIQTVKNHLSNEELLNATTTNPTSFINKLALFEWSWSLEKSVNLENRIDDNEWLPFLASSYFILATPGIRMPLCFNVVEAMSVGTIPIIQYPEHFNPPLEHGLNALVFDDRIDLIDKIKLALKLSPEVLNEISKNTIEYYDKYLHPKRIAFDIEQMKDDRITLYINAEQASLDDYYYRQQTREES